MVVHRHERGRFASTLTTTHDHHRVTAPRMFFGRRKTSNNTRLFRKGPLIKEEQIEYIATTRSIIYATEDEYIYIYTLRRDSPLSHDSDPRERRDSPLSHETLGVRSGNCGSDLFIFRSNF